MGAVLLSQSRTDVFDLTADVRAGKNTYEFRFDVMAPATLPLKVTSKQHFRKLAQYNNPFTRLWEEYAHVGIEATGNCTSVASC